MTIKTPLPKYAITKHFRNNDELKPQFSLHQNKIYIVYKVVVQKRPFRVHFFITKKKRCSYWIH